MSSWSELVALWKQARAFRARRRRGMSSVEGMIVLTPMTRIVGAALGGLWVVALR